jgi:hypothetical protein
LDLKQEIQIQIQIQSGWISYVNLIKSYKEVKVLDKIMPQIDMRVHLESMML